MAKAKDLSPEKETLRETPKTTDKLSESYTMFSKMSREALIRELAACREALETARGKLNGRGEDDRVITEPAYRQSEEKYKDLFEHVNDAIVILNKDLAIEDFNKAFEELVEGSKEDIRCLKVKDIVFEQDKKASEAFFKKLKKKGYYRNFEGRIKTLKGDVKYIQVSSTAIYKNGQFAGSRDILRDITKQKEIEHKLRQAHSAMESSLNAVFTADLAGKVTYANKAAARLWGYEDVKDMTKEKTQVLDYWTTASQERALEIIKQLKTEGNYKGDEGLIGLRKDGSVFETEILANIIADDQGSPIGMVASFNDITERKKAEQALKESEQRLRSIYENTLVNIFTVDKKGTIKSLNHPAPGLKNEDVIGSSIFDYYTDEKDKKKARERLKQVFSKKRSETYETRIEHPGLPGGEAYYYNSLSPIIIDGKVELATFIAQDVTKEKQSEKALRENESFLKAVFSNSLNGILVADDQGTYSSVNAAATKMLGYPGDKLIGMNVSELNISSMRNIKINFRKYVKKGTETGGV